MMKILSLIALTFNIFLNQTFTQNFTFSAEADLNSDNITEKISLQILDNPWEFKLKIDDNEIKGEFNSDGIDGFIIIDIDKNDKLKEIAVHTPGPSDDDEYLVYWYDGNKIFLMEYFGGWPEFQGNGMVYLDQWQGFWARRDKYVLDKEKRKMKFIEQFAYYVGAKVTVKNSFTIYKETNLKDEVALLKKGSEVEILICDCIKREYFDYKYLIKSESGLLGWSGIDAILENTEGLIMAD